MKVQDKKSFIFYIAIILVSAFFLNNISREKHFRLDLTDTQMFTLSESSLKVVDKIDDLLTMQVFFSEDLPNQMGNNKRFLQDLLEEYRAAQNDHNIEFEFFKTDNEEEFESEAMKYGIQPVQVQVVENDKIEIKKVFIGMVMLYNDNRETIPVIQTTTGLEYDITTRIKKLVNVKNENIAFAKTGDQEDIKNENITHILRQHYNVRNITLDTEVSKDISLLILNGVTDSLSSDEYFNLKEFIDSGGNLLVAQNRLTANTETQQATPIESDIFTLLKDYGLGIEENLVLDNNCMQVGVRQPVNFLGMKVFQNIPADYPFFPIIQQFNSESEIVSGLEQVVLRFPSEISFDSTNTQCSYSELFKTSNESSSMTEFYNLNPFPDQNPIFTQLNEHGKVIGAQSIYTDAETEISSAIILISDSQFLSDEGGMEVNTRSGGFSFPQHPEFILNSVDYLAGESDLIALRSREISTRPLNDLAKDDSVKNFWKFVNYVLPSLLVIGMGIIKLGIESGRAKRLEMEFE